VLYVKPSTPRAIFTPWVWICAVIIIILSGIVYRVLASHLKLIVETPIELPVPLSEFPMEVTGWVGRDVPIPDNIQRVAKNDDFLNRLYINERNDQWANIYVAYSARPRTMLGHRPQVCYVGGGWIHDDTRASEFTTSTGRKVPCLIHRFHIPAPQSEVRVVLNFYILNGQITADESGFSGVGWRTPNIKGDPARYVAQVQISSVVENSVLKAGKDMTELILEFFPDEEDIADAMEGVETSKNKLEVQD
jgi:hypothetical protein